MNQDPFKIFSTTTISPFPHFMGTKEEVYDWLSKNTYGPDGFEVYETESNTAQDARKFLEENNPFTPKFYRMNPETEELLPNGRHLANGMKVLIESPAHRMRVSDDLTDWQEDRALENNQWCTIGALEVVGDMIRFIGVYNDGSKRIRTFQAFEAWLVKTDSIREVEDRKAQVHTLVSDAMSEAVLIMEHGKTPRERALRAGLKAEETTKQILELL
jgi:hypothetical protein